MVRLATFNMESFGDARFDAGTLAPRIEVLRPELCALEADILCLQEVNAQKPSGEKIRCFAALDLLLADTPYADFHRVTSTRPDRPVPSDRHNLVVLSRFPILSHTVHYGGRIQSPLWRPLFANPPVLEPSAPGFDRPVLEAVLDLGLARPLHLFVVHLRAPIAVPIPGGKLSPTAWRCTEAWAEGYFLSVLKRAGQALDLRLAIDALFDRDPAALIAVAGDFNATQDTGALHLLLANPDDTGNADLALRALHQLDAQLSPAARQTVIHRGRGQALDHILASPGLARHLTTIKVFNDGLADEVLDAGTRAHLGSFHAPICAGFEFSRDDG